MPETTLEQALRAQSSSESKAKCMEAEGQGWLDEGILIHMKLCRNSLFAHPCRLNREPNKGYFVSDSLWYLYPLAQGLPAT